MVFAIVLALIAVDSLPDLSVVGAMPIVVLWLMVVSANFFWNRALSNRYGRGQ